MSGSIGHLVPRSALVVALALAPEAFAGPTELPVPLGATSSSARASLEGALEGTVWYAASDRQGLARGLIDTGLLRMLNRFALLPRTEEGAPDARAFREVAVGRLEGRRYVLAFGGAGADPVLAFILMTIPTPVDRSNDTEEGWSPRRLDPLRRALAAFASYGLKPIEADERGNAYAYAWRGRAGTREVIVWYLPEDDELWALIRSADPFPR